MNEELTELQNEIDLLNRRIGVLEKKESRRQSLGYLKLIIKILLIGAIVFGIWKGYEYIVHEIPNMMEEKIKSINPFKKN